MGMKVPGAPDVAQQYQTGTLSTAGPTACAFVPTLGDFAVHLTGSGGPVVIEASADGGVTYAVVCYPGSATPIQLQVPCYTQLTTVAYGMKYQFRADTSFSGGTVTCYFAKG